MRVVLAATDFSHVAHAAVRRAAVLCRDRGAEMHLVYVSRTSGAPGYVSRLRQASARMVSEFGVPVQTHLGTGSPPAEIATRAHILGADLVVLGNSKKGFLAEIFGMNKALRTYKRSGLPVLAVSDPDARPYARVLIPVDLSAEGGRAAREALRFFPVRAPVVLHAVEAPYAGMRGNSDVSPELARQQEARDFREGVAALDAFATEQSLRDAVLQVELGHPALRTRAQATRMKADLVVLHPGKRWITSSVTEHLVVDPPCDLLLMP